MDNECCGTCRFHVRGEITGQGDWICNNGMAEEYGIETPYSHSCSEYEIVKRAFTVQQIQ